MTLQERIAVAHEAWVDAELAAAEASARYIVVHDVSELHRQPELILTDYAAEKLTALRQAAQAAQDAYMDAVHRG